MSYCKDALKLFNKKVICGKDCPIVHNCPRLIMEDATDDAINKAILAMREAFEKEKVTFTKEVK